MKAAGCKDHPKYQGNYRPMCSCGRCWQIWFERRREAGDYKDLEKEQLERA